MPVIKLPDGRRVKFPDTMSEADIVRVIETELMPKTVPDPEAIKSVNSYPFERISGPGVSYKPTGEPITPERRRAEGEVIAREQIKPILQGVGAMVGGMGGGVGAIPLAGAGAATGERIAEALAGRPVGTPTEEGKRFAVETGKGAALEAAGMGVGKVVGKGVEALSRKLYESAVKFTTKLSHPERAKYAKAGLDQAIFPTEKGLIRLEGKIDKVNKGIEDAIKIATKKGNVSTNAVASEIEKTKKMFKFDIDFEDEIVPVLDNLKEKLLKFGDTISPEHAQGMKVAAYRSLKGKYGEMKDFAIEGKKGLARGLMQELERLYPDIKNLNKTHSAYRGLEEQVTRAAGRISNREMLSLLASTAAAAGGAAHQGPEGLWYGLVVQSMVSPRSKTGIGIFLNKALKASGATTSARRLVLPGLFLGEDEPLKESIESQTRR